MMDEGRTWGEYSKGKWGRMTLDRTGMRPVPEAETSGVTNWTHTHEHVLHTHIVNMKYDLA